MDRKPFLIDEFVRWSDVDQAGIIFYGAYVRFFEIAETELFRHLGVPYSELFDRYDIWLPRVHLDVDFHYPARLDDQLAVATYFPEIGNSSVHIAFDVWHVVESRFAATAKEVLVCTDRSTMKSRHLPGELLELFETVTMSHQVARNWLEAAGSSEK